LRTNRNMAINIILGFPDIKSMSVTVMIFGCGLTTPLFRLGHPPR